MKDNVIVILPILCCSNCMVGPNHTNFCPKSDNSVFVCKCFVGKEK